MKRSIPFLALLSLSLPVAAQDAPVTFNGQTFANYWEYMQSPLFDANGGRCATSRMNEGLAGHATRSQSDCSLSNTSILPEYDPNDPINGDTLEIPVVVHVLESSTGQGAMTDARVQSQIRILNEDFLALNNTNGENGNKAKIHFALAKFDPSNNPTTGITRTVNDSWFNDSGAYYNTLAWDTSRYLNIYTNQASGALGYAFLPQSGGVGANFHRVVILHSSFGLNAPIGPPFNKGRTSTHEVGHYFGLLHTFSGGCAGGSCSSGGDLICDTNNEQNPAFGCPSSNSCSSPDPTDNYMDYSDDLCMEQFTPDQVNRMRCTITQWMPNLPRARGFSDSRNGSGSNPAGFTQRRRPIIGGDWKADIDLAGASAGIVRIALGGPLSGVFLSFGELLIAPPFLGGDTTLDGLHVIPIPHDFSLLNLTFSTQGFTFSPGTVIAQNALDMTIGY